MRSLVEIMQRVAEREVDKIYTIELGVVTSVFPHAAESDKDNYQCSVTLKNRKQPDGSDFELRRVPVATQHIGLANIPNIGDLVAVSFVNGDINAPIVLGRLYNDEDLPPENDISQFVLSRVETVSITTDAGTTIVVDGDGNVTINAKGDVTINDGSKGAARQDDSVEVTIPSGTFLTAAQAGVPNAAPVKVQGTITSASETVKIGD